MTVRNIFHGIQPDWPYSSFNNVLSEIAEEIYQVNLDEEPFTPPDLTRVRYARVKLAGNKKSYWTITRQDNDHLYVTETSWSGPIDKFYLSWEHLQGDYLDRGLKDYVSFEEHGADAWAEIATKHGEFSEADFWSLRIARRAAYKRLNEEDYGIISRAFMELYINKDAYRFIEPRKRKSRSKRSIYQAMQVFERAKDLCENGHKKQSVSLKGSRKALSAFDLIADEFNVSYKSAQRYYAEGRRAHKKYSQAIKHME